MVLCIADVSLKNRPPICHEVVHSMTVTIPFWRTKGMEMRTAFNLSSYPQMGGMCIAPDVGATLYAVTWIMYLFFSKSIYIYIQTLILISIFILRNLQHWHNNIL